MKNLNILYAFLGGAVVGCAAAILFAPEKGSDLRNRIKTPNNVAFNELINYLNAFITCK